MKKSHPFFLIGIFIFGITLLNMGVLYFLPEIVNFFPYFERRPVQIILSDILFLEGGIFLIIGSILAGASFYSLAAPGGLKAEYSRRIFDWRLLLKERDIPSTLTIGLTVLLIGVICLVSAVLIAQ